MYPFRASVWTKCPLLGVLLSARCLFDYALSFYITTTRTLITTSLIRTVGTFSGPVVVHTSGCERRPLRF